MNICVPVTEDRGLESPVCAHFGSAPLFMVLDIKRGTCRPVANRNRDHGHGMCRPLDALERQDIVGVLVGGIGRGAFMKLRAAGVRVFLADRPTVGDAMAAFRAGTLREVTPATACGGHGHGPAGRGTHAGYGRR